MKRKKERKVELVISIQLTEKPELGKKNKIGKHERSEGGSKAVLANSRIKRKKKHNLVT